VPRARRIGCSGPLGRGVCEYRTRCAQIRPISTQSRQPMIPIVLLAFGERRGRAGRPDRRHRHRRLGARTDDRSPRNAIVAQLGGGASLSLSRGERQARSNNRAFFPLMEGGRRRDESERAGQRRPARLDQGRRLASELARTSAAARIRSDLRGRQSATHTRCSSPNRPTPSRSAQSSYDGRSCPARSHLARRLGAILVPCSTQRPSLSSRVC
jgi:hypothetical protein